MGRNAPLSSNCRVGRESDFVSLFPFQFTGIGISAEMIAPSRVCSQPVGTDGLRNLPVMAHQVREADIPSNAMFVIENALPILGSGLH